MCLSLASYKESNGESKECVTLQKIITEDDRNNWKDPRKKDEVAKGDTTFNLRKEQKKRKEAPTPICSATADAIVR